MAFSILAPMQVLAAGCEGYDVSTFVSDAPYLLSRMNVEGEASPTAMVLVHADDPGIRGQFSLLETDPAGSVSRSQFIGQSTLTASSRARSLQEQGYAEVQHAVYPFDPITWLVTARSADGQGLIGEMNISLASECEMQVAWSAPNDSVLAGRVAEFRSSLDAVRSFAGSHVSGIPYLEENTSPKGTSAMLVAVVAPLLAAAALAFILWNMRNLPRPGASHRLLQLGSAAIAGGAAYWHLGALQAGVATFQVLMLGMVGAAILSLLISAAWARQAAFLLGCSFSIVVGLAVSVANYFGWMGDRMVSIVLALALVVVPVLALQLWQRARTVRRQVKKVRPT